MYSIQDFNEFARKTENKVREFLREGCIGLAGQGHGCFQEDPQTNGFQNEEEGS